MHGLMQRTVMLARASTCHWRAKTKTPLHSHVAFGSARVLFIALFFVGCCGILYLFAVNQSAVQGRTLRTLEYDLAALHKEREQLQIREAELTSLYWIASAGEDLKMHPATEIRYIDEESPLARR